MSVELPNGGIRYVAVSCGDKKQDVAAPACELYTGSLYRAHAEIADRLGGVDFILSALHGLLEAGQVIEPYDVTLRTMGKAQRTEWSEAVAEQILELLRPGIDELVVLAGKDYVGFVPLVEDAGLMVFDPLQGMEVGYRRRVARMLREHPEIAPDPGDAEAWAALGRGEIPARRTSTYREALTVFPWTHYASGSNEVGQILGLAEAGYPIGITTKECLERRGCEDALVEASGYPFARVFVDSGAYSEIKSNKPITDDQWRARLALARRIADVFGSRALIVAPDKVGDQDETLRRLSRYRDEIGEILEAGAEVMVVLQPGRLGRREFELEVIDRLGHDDFVPGLPMRMGATTEEELYEYVEQARPHRLHLLGIGPTNPGNRKLGVPRASTIPPTIAEISPETIVTWDSNLRAAWTPWDVVRPSPRDPFEPWFPGPKDPRSLSREEYLTRADFVAAAIQGAINRAYEVGGVSFDLDWTEVAATPSLYLRPLYGRKYSKKARELALEAGLGGEDIEAFVADPDAFLAQEVVDQRGGMYERWELEPLLESLLEREFGTLIGSEHAQEVKRVAIKRVLEEKGMVPTPELLAEAQHQAQMPPLDELNEEETAAEEAAQGESAAGDKQLRLFNRRLKRGLIR